MSIESSPFGGCRLTGEDAKAFRRQFLGEDIPEAPCDSDGSRMAEMNEDSARGEADESSYWQAMRRDGHRRWQKGREWGGASECPVPRGAPVSIWRKTGRYWIFRHHADRLDWTQVRAYRLEHGTPYPDHLPSPIRVHPELAGTLPPALQFRLDRIETTLARIEAIAMEARQGRDREAGLDGEAATARAGTASPTSDIRTPIKDTQL